MFDEETEKSITITVRFIKNFEFRTTKNLVLHDIGTRITIEELQKKSLEKMKDSSGFKPYLNVTFGILLCCLVPFNDIAQLTVTNSDRHYETVRKGSRIEDSKSDHKSR